jgi:hypothetical protein
MVDGIAAAEKELPQTGTEPASATSDSEPITWNFTGRAFEEYRFRRATNLTLAEPAGLSTTTSSDIAAPENDHDLRLLLDGYMWESSDRFSADFAMSVWYDLNGASKASQPTSFGSVEDYQAPQPWHTFFDVYSLYGEYRARLAPVVLRAGRQTPELGRPFTFDGISLSWVPFGPTVEMAIMGGRSVHFFELNDNLFEDWLGSAAAVFRPIKQLRVDMDYMFTSETTLSKNHFVGHDRGISAWWRPTDFFQVRAHVRGLNDDLSRVGGRTKFEWNTLELGLEAGVDCQPTTLSEINEMSDPYYAILGESLPFIRMDGAAWKDFTTRIGIYGIRIGWNDRRLLDHTPTPFNRNFGRAFLELHASDFGIKGLFLTGVFEYHYTHGDDDGNDESVFSAGGSGGYRKKPVSVLIGTDYYSYKYNYYADVEEREDVRSYFGEMKFDLLDWLSASARYEFEMFDRDIHTVTISLSQKY